MPVPIALGQNFDCLVLARGNPTLGHEVQLRDDLWATDGLPVAPAEHWEQWLGSLILDALRGSFVLTVTAKQPTPGIVYREELRRRLFRLQYALNLLGICGYNEGFFIAGANERGTAEVRQFGRTRSTFHLSRGAELPPFDVDELKRAVRLSERLEIVDKEGAYWRRLRRGIDALNNGLAERNYQDSRIHQFVRSLEALILPEQGRSTSLFVHRCQTFVVAGADASETLKQAYDIRSQVEHLHNALDVISGATIEEREESLYRRARQMDQLARFATSRVLESDALLEIFKQDSNIAAFWKLADDERLKIWGSRLDLSRIA